MSFPYIVICWRLGFGRLCDDFWVYGVLEIFSTFNSFSRIERMSGMKNERGGRKMAKGHKDSPSLEEMCGDGNLGGDGTLKKGPWTAAEDAILVDYVTKHGEGNWNAVQKHSGLSRCGKSCRLRWANHLRPDLKKGAFTPDEERRIIELHAKMGNKWARMAAELPGRTDNEIKNYWNTRLKRRQRAGLPIYPPDMCLHIFNGSQESLNNMGTLEAGDARHADPLDGDSFEIPDVEFQNLELGWGILAYAPPFVDIHASSILKQGITSYNNFSPMFPAMHPPKRPRESETLFSCGDGGSSTAFPMLNQHENISEPFGSSALFHPDLSSNHQMPFGGFPGSHAFLNGNSSSSEPVSRAMKSELPSLQYSETQQSSSWDMLASPLHSFESDDTLIQYPPTELQQAQAVSASPRSSGLLEAVLYESQALKRQKKSSIQHTSDLSAVLTDAVNSLSVKAKPCEQEWEVNGDPNSPLARSTASVFRDSPDSPEESQMAYAMEGCDVKPEETSSRRFGKKEYQAKMDFSRPDAMLGSGWFGCGNSKQGKDQSVLHDTLGALGEDFFQ